MWQNKMYIFSGYFIEQIKNIVGLNITEKWQMFSFVCLNVSSLPQGQKQLSNIQKCSVGRIMHYIPIQDFCLLLLNLDHSEWLFIILAYCFYCLSYNINYCVFAKPCFCILNLCIILICIFIKSIQNGDFPPPPPTSSVLSQSPPLLWGGGCNGVEDVWKSVL